MKFLVIIGDSTKPICCDDPVTMYNLQQVTRLRFGLGSERLKFKYWDEEWNEFVDLEDCRQLRDRSKLKVILVRNSTHSYPLQVPSEPMPSTSRAPEHMAFAEDILEFEDQSQDQGSSSTHTSKPDWPDDFHICEETLPSQLKEALAKKVDLTKPGHRYLRGLLLSAVIDKALTYTSYPDKLQKLQMAKAIIRQWPHLASKWGGPTDGWMACIIDKLKNRRRGQHEVGRRRPGVGQSKQVHVAKRKQEAPPLMKIDPQLLAESNKSSEEMIVEMKEEMRKVEGERDISKLRCLFLATFPQRRELLSASSNIDQVMEDYPFLFTRDGLATDFEVLTNSTDVLREFHVNSSLKAMKILDMGKAQLEKLSKSSSQKSAERRARLQRVVEMMDIAMEESWCTEDPSRQVAYHHALSALLMLPQLLGEEDDMLLQEFPEAASLSEITAGPVTPYISCVGSAHSSSLFYLVLANKAIIALHEALDAMATLCLSYYVFGLQYPKHCECTLKFIQMQILQQPIEKSSKIPPKLLSFMNKVE